MPTRQWGTGVQFDYLKSSWIINIFKQNTEKYNSFQVTTDFLNSENPKITIGQYMQGATGLQFYYVIADPKVRE